MTSLLFLPAVILTLLAQAPASDHGARDVRVMSFNIRYGSADDGENSWSYRKDLVFEALRRERYDFIGLQEALLFQVDEILEHLPDYGVLVRSRERDPGQGETCALLYLRDRWELDELSSGTFWLSESPEVPGSKSWDSSLPRIATWGLFRDRSERLALYVYNTHFDHRGERARLESAKLLRKRAAARATSHPVVILGDFNAGESSPPLAWLTGGDDEEVELFDSWRSLHPTERRAGTFNAWQSRSDGPKIDYVLVGEEVQVLEAEIARTTPGARHASDHDPVTATLRLP